MVNLAAIGLHFLLREADPEGQIRFPEEDLKT
jgi:hypothetical protein